MGWDRAQWGTHRLVVGDQHAQQVGHLHGVHGGHNDVAVVGVWNHGEWNRGVHPLYPGNLEPHLVQDGSTAGGRGIVLLGPGKNIGERATSDRDRSSCPLLLTWDGKLPPQTARNGGSLNTARSRGYLTAVAEVVAFLPTASP